MRTPHTHYPKGKRVLVILKNKERFVAKFWKEEKGVIYFLDHEIVRVRRIRAMTYFNPSL